MIQSKWTFLFQSVAGTDIADLLLKDRLFTSTSDGTDATKPDVASPDEGVFDSGGSASSSQKNTPDEQDHVPSMPLQKSKVVDKFREYLLFGHKKVSFYDFDLCLRVISKPSPPHPLSHPLGCFGLGC